MSLTAITWAFNVELPMAAKFVLVALANYANEQGECYPSQARLAADTGQTERSVRLQLGKLEGLGFITRSKRRTGRGRQGSDLYALNWFDWLHTVKQGASRRNDVPAGQGDQAERGSGTRRNVVPVQAERGSACSIEEPPLNPQLNQNARARDGGAAGPDTAQRQGAAPGPEGGPGKGGGGTGKGGAFPPNNWPMWKQGVAVHLLTDPGERGKWNPDTIRSLLAQKQPRWVVCWYAMHGGVVRDLPTEYLRLALDTKRPDGKWLVPDDLLAQRGLTRPDAPP